MLVERPNALPRHLFLDQVLLLVLGDLALGDDLVDIFDNGFEFFFLAQEYQIVEINTLNINVGGNNHHLQTIDLLEFIGFGISRTGHTR